MSAGGEGDKVEVSAHYVCLLIDTHLFYLVR